MRKKWLRRPKCKSIRISSYILIHNIHVQCHLGCAMTNKRQKQRVGKRADTISERKRKLRHPYSYRHCKLCTLLHVCKIVCNTQINSVFLLYHALWTGALLIILTHKEHRLMSENWTFLFPKKNPNSRSLPGLITHQWSI